MSGYTGDVAGLTFDDGRLVTENPSPEAVRAAADYFARRGLRLQGGRVDARDAVATQVGTPLRDAAVDPEPGDFLAPTSAGQADPHGPEVVSPEIHGSQGTRPVRGGRVSPLPDVQVGAELGHLQEATATGVPAGPGIEAPADGTEVLLEADGDAPEPPAKSAVKAEWVAHAVACGLDEGTAEAMTKAELVAAYGVDG